MVLAHAINNYLKSDRDHLIDMRNYFESLSFREAIEKASIGEGRDGKMNSHQWRVGRKKGERGAIELLKKESEIKKCKTFEEIFSITEEVRRELHGLGDLWSYDTALRIGFNLKLYPKNVYVQSGVVNGVRKVLNGKRPKGRSLSLSIFPVALRQLQPYEAENFLCIWGKNRKVTYC